jgi:hypothetical protein
MSYEQDYVLPCIAQFNTFFSLLMLIFWVVTLLQIDTYKSTCVTTQKTNIGIFTAMKTSNLIFISLKTLEFEL